MKKYEVFELLKAQLKNRSTAASQNKASAKPSSEELRRFVGQYVHDRLSPDDAIAKLKDLQANASEHEIHVQEVDELLSILEGHFGKFTSTERKQERAYLLELIHGGNSKQEALNRWLENSAFDISSTETREALDEVNDELTPGKIDAVSLADERAWAKLVEDGRLLPWDNEEIYFQWKENDE